MCLDPRPDSLVRVRPSATRTQPAPRPDASAHATSHAARATHPEARDSWRALTDSLDLRGWTLVSRTVASC